MRQDQLRRIAEEQMAGRKEQKAREPGFLFYHGLRVAGIALELADALHIAVDRDVLYAGALFHDIGKGAVAHNERGAEIALDLLRDLFDESHLARVVEIVRLHNQRGDAAEHPVAAKIVQDADALDHFGPASVWLTFYWSGVYGETIHDHIRYVASEETAAHHAARREALNFGVSRRFFDERLRWEKTFLEQFRRTYFEGVWHEGAGT